MNAVVYHHLHVTTTNVALIHEEAFSVYVMAISTDRNASTVSTMICKTFLLQSNLQYFTEPNVICC